MRGLWARLLAVGIAAFGALTILTLSAPLVSASSRVNGYSAQVGPLKVQIFSQMCDNFGPVLHTRLAVKNTSSSPKQIVVHDAFATVVYDPPGAIPPGKGMLVHLTSSRRTPTHSLTLAADGQTKTMTVPASPGSCTTTTTKSTTTTTKPGETTTTTGSGSTTTSSTVVVNPGGGGDPGGGGVVTGPGVVVVGASLRSTAAVRAASTGTLPFTGSDIRSFAVLGNLMVLIGFAMLYVSHRSPRAAAFFKRLRPGTAS